MSGKRDSSIDIVRAIAIILMIAANMAVLTHDEPAWIFRLMFSIAAPTFLILCGMMVTLGRNNKLTFSAIVKRGGFIFLLAGMLDIAVYETPYVSFDVLYLIGLSLPLVFLACRFSNTVLLCLIVALIGSTPYLQWLFGYRFIFLELPTDNLATLAGYLTTEIPRRYLIDGWFPLLPWLAMPLFGALLGRFRYQTSVHTSFQRPIYVLVAFLLITIAGVLWWLFPGAQGIRNGYAELFYPAVPGFMFLVMGITLLLIICIDAMHKAFVWKWIMPLGEISLLIYLLHLILIKHVLVPMGTISFGFLYFGYYLILLGLMICIGFASRKLRAQTFYQKRFPRFARMIFGS